MKCKSKRKQILAGTLAAAMALGNATFVMAAPAPDGKTNAQELSSSMGTNELWENWKREWESVKTDWTQMSLTPGSDESQLNFAWYSKKTITPASDSADTLAAKNEDTSVPLEENAGEAEENVVVEDADADLQVSMEPEISVESVEEQTQVATEDSQTDSISQMVEELLGADAAATAPKLIIGEGRNLKNAKAYVAFQTDATVDSATGTEYYSNKVTATGLKENTTYYYSYQQEDGIYTEPQEYRTKDADAFSFIYVGDPQIGSSNELKGAATEEFYNAQSDAVRNDSFNWEATLNAAMAKTGEQASFVVSAGDQIQTTKKKAPNKDAANSEIEYAGYLSPDVLKSLPVATTVGNHDADNENYTYHFNTPNNSELGSNGVVGGDYFFSYGPALFMMLNTQDTNVAEHKQFMEQAIAENPDCTWRIVTLHQDIYGSAEHSNEPEITNLRYELVPYFEANDVDVVLMGHDHAYSRSQILKGGVKTTEYTDDEFDEQHDKDVDAGENPATVTTAPANIKADTTDPDEQKYLDYLNEVMDKNAVEQTDGETVVNPEGILYMTANSSSGSKYYDLVPRMQTYIANRWQEDVPTYSVVDITDQTFTINTYRTDNDEQIDNTFTIQKSDAPVEKTDLSKAVVASVSKQVYTGKAIKPALKVTCNGKALKENTDYTVTYSNNVNTGLAKAVIQGRGDYEGSKNISFKIIPKSVKLKSVKSNEKKTVKVTYEKAKGKVSGYQIVYSTNRAFSSVKAVRTTKTSYTLKSLTSRKTYYIKVRAYKTIDGKRTYGTYGNTLKVTVK